MDVMTNSTHRGSWKGPIELAVVVSTLCLTIALALSWFVGVSEQWLMLGTIVAASVIGWTQPAARLRPALVRHSSVSVHRRQTA